MTSATLLSSNLSTVPSPSVGVALRELGGAAQKLGLALWVALLQRSSTASRVLTAREEADQVRDMANAMMHTDPGFAQDLYAAADRHEEAARA